VDTEERAEMTILNTPDPHIFGAGRQQIDPNPQPEATRLFHVRREKLVQEHKEEAKQMAARHAAEKADLDAKFDLWHHENRDLFSGKRR
jgi:hypothetical protein